jgi:hypothetical protein
MMKMELNRCTEVKNGKKRITEIVRKSSRKKTGGKENTNKE